MVNKKKLMCLHTEPRICLLQVKQVACSKEPVTILLLDATTFITSSHKFLALLQGNYDNEQLEARLETTVANRQRVFPLDQLSRVQYF